MKFKKKPVVIDAMLWSGGNVEELSDFFGDFKHWRIPRCDHVEIETLEGFHEARPGDWIIKGVKGEFYPCKPDIFDITYEAVG